MALSSDVDVFDDNLACNEFLYNSRVSAVPKRQLKTTVELDKTKREATKLHSNVVTDLHTSVNSHTHCIINLLERTRMRHMLAIHQCNVKQTMDHMAGHRAEPREHTETSAPGAFIVIGKIAHCGGVGDHWVNLGAFNHASQCTPMHGFIQAREGGALESPPPQKKKKISKGLIQLVDCLYCFGQNGPKIPRVLIINIFLGVGGHAPRPPQMLMLQ